MIETDNKPETFSPFTVQQSGNIGQEILNADGRIICWTTDEWVAQVIVKLLTEHEGLLEKERLFQHKGQ